MQVLYRDMAMVTAMVLLNVIVPANHGAYQTTKNDEFEIVHGGETG